MAKEFTEMEVSIIKNMMTTKPARTIADLISRSKQDVMDAIKMIADENGIVSRQSKLDTEEAIRRKNRPTPLPRKKIEKEKPQKQANVEKAWEDRKKENQRRQPAYQTKKVDYSKLRSLRIDAKTFIYIKPDEDPKKAKEDFLEKYHKLLKMAIQKED